MKVKYWIAVDTDQDEYSARVATKKEANAYCDSVEEGGYEPPYPVVVEYESGMDLLQRALGASKFGWEEGQAQRLYYQTNRAYREWYDQTYPHEEWMPDSMSDPVDPDYLALTEK